MFRLLAPCLLAAVSCAAQCVLTLTPTLPTGALGAPYPGNVVHGGAGPWTYAVTNGSLPSGLSVTGNGGAAIFTGTAVAAGTFDFGLRVTDANNCEGTAALRIVIGGDLSVQPPVLSNASMERTYFQILGLNAGNVPLNVINASLIAGNLPTGLSIANTGGSWAISGTPQQSGSFDFTVQVTGGAGFSATRRYVIVVTGLSPVVATPNPLKVTVRLGEPLPGSQPLQIATSDGGSYRFRVTAVSPGFRLENVPSELQTPTTLQPVVQPLLDVPGVYTGYIELTPTDGNGAPTRIPVELTIQPPPVLLVEPEILTVSMRQNDPPVNRTIQLRSSDLPLSFVIETLTPIGGNWLALTPVIGDTPASLNVVFNPVGLPPGVYAGTIRVLAKRGTVTAGGSPRTIAVSLTVDQPMNTSGFTASPAALSFTGQAKSTLLTPQPLRINNAGGAISWTASATAGWLVLSQTTGTTPTDITVNVQPGTLTPGTYAGAYTFTSGATTITVPVTLTLTPAPEAGEPYIRVSPEVLYGAVSPSNPKISWNIGVDGYGKNHEVEFNPTVEWLIPSAPRGVTPTGVTLLADGTKLAPGTHRGALIAVTTIPTLGLKSSGVVNVSLDVHPDNIPVGPGVLVPSTSILFFDWRQGNSLPLPQKLRLSSGGLPVTWDAVSTVNWINLSQATGTTPNELEISVSPQFLGAGNYRGEIRFRRGQEEIGIVNVVLSVGGVGSVRSEPSALVFLVETGRDVAPQIFQLSRFDTVVSTSYTVRSTPEWLSVTPRMGTTPARLEAVILRDKLPQAVNGVIRMEGEIAVESESSGVQIPVLLTIVPAQGPPVGRELPWILSVTNAASTQPGPVAPGEHVTLYGGFEGREVRVWFDGNAAPLLAQAANQLTVAVPFAVAGRASTRVRVEVDALSSRDLELRVADTAPGIFTVNKSGRGFAKGWTEDGSDNAENPAASGALASVLVNGLGLTDPPGIDGDLVRGDGGPRPLIRPEIRIGGVVGDLVICEVPPGEYQGVSRCLFRVPGIEAGDHPITVTSGGVTSQPGVQFRVK